MPRSLNDLIVSFGVILDNALQRCGVNMDTLIYYPRICDFTDQCIIIKYTSLSTKFSKFINSKIQEIGGAITGHGRFS